MDYLPVLSSNAAKVFKSLPSAVRQAVAERIRELGESPSKHSRSAVFPYLPKGQVSIVQCPLTSGDIFVVSIHFRFGQDEQTIEIVDFGHYILSGDEDEPPS